MGYPSAYPAFVLIGCLAICAVTDILYRRVSETLIGICAVVLLILEWTWSPWWYFSSAVVSGLLCGALWWLADRHHAAMGDVEMAALIGLALGPFSIGALFCGSLIAVITRKCWPRLAGPKVSHDERGLAPMGLYMFVGVVITVVLIPWILSLFLRR